jgi:hypothetical protein
MPATVESGKFVVPNDVFMLHWSTSVNSPVNFMPLSRTIVTDCGCSFRPIVALGRGDVMDALGIFAAGTATAVGTAGTGASSAWRTLTRENKTNFNPIKVRMLMTFLFKNMD